MSTYRRSTPRFEEYAPSCSAKTVRFLFILLFSYIGNSIDDVVFCFTLITGGEPGQSVTRVCDWNGAFILIFIRTFIIRSALMGNWTDTFVYYRDVRG